MTTLWITLVPILSKLVNPPKGVQFLMKTLLLELVTDISKNYHVYVALTVHLFPCLDTGNETRCGSL